MGAKSTETLTRTYAEQLLGEFNAELYTDVQMSDKELEDELERLNDLIYQKQGYYQGLSNYRIE